LIIDYCEFPDDLLYDVDGSIWIRIDPDASKATIGLTSLMTGIAGKLSSVRTKPVGTIVSRGRSLGTLESHRMVGPMPSPLSGTIVEINEKISGAPKILNDSAYEEGWIVCLRLSNLEAEKQELSSVEGIRSLVKQRIAEFHVRCFKLFPDHEMYEIGSECSAVLVRLNELMDKVTVGDVVHIVSDDPTAYVEMVAWSDRTGHELVEWRREGNLFHFIVRKIEEEDRKGEKGAIGSSRRPS
jgi:glycine cleavage system H protein